MWILLKTEGCRREKDGVIKRILVYISHRDNQICKCVSSFHIQIDIKWVLTVEHSKTVYSYKLSFRGDDD